MCEDKTVLYVLVGLFIVGILHVLRIFNSVVETKHLEKKE